MALIDAGEGGELAALAVRLGWYDQAHFTRDFAAVVGQSPAAYAASTASATSAVSGVAGGSVGGSGGGATRR